MNEISMKELFKDFVSDSYRLGDVTPRYDTRFNVEIKRSVNKHDISKHFMNAFGYIMRSMEKEKVLNER